MFEEAKAVLIDIETLKRKVADRAVRSSSKLVGLYADFDIRLTASEGKLAKALDDHALNVEAVVKDLTNLGEQASAESSGEPAAPMQASTPDTPAIQPDARRFDHATGDPLK